MKNTVLQICDALIQPGEISNLALPLPEYNSCLAFYMPIKVINGKHNGPCVLVLSGMDRNEFNGIEIVNRLLDDEVINDLKGSLIIVPIMNILGLVKLNSVTQEKKIDECFPGDENGSYSERIAKIFIKEIFSKATHCIELKTGEVNYDILPQIYCNIGNLETKKLAEKFAPPVISTMTQPNSLEDTANSLQIPFLTYKGGEALRFDELSIKIGVEGILRVLEELAMIKLPDEEKSSNLNHSVFSVDQEWFRSHRSGILVSKVMLGEHVKQNDTLGIIKDPFNSNLSDLVKAPKDGIIVGINRNPLIYEGQNIFKIASFIDNDRAESVLEDWVAQKEIGNGE